MILIFEIKINDLYTTLSVPVAVEEDEVVLDEVHQDLPDELAHVHPADHLLKDLVSWDLEMAIDNFYLTNG